MRWLLALLAWIGSLALLVPVSFLVVMFRGATQFAAPLFLQPLVLVLGWAIVLVAPIAIARAVWRRVGRTSAGGAV